MKKTEQITDIPDEHVDVVVADFEAIGAQVTKSRQSNGNWPVTAVISESSQQTYVA